MCVAGPVFLGNQRRRGNGIIERGGSDARVVGTGWSTVFPDKAGKRMFGGTASSSDDT